MSNSSEHSQQVKRLSPNSCERCDDNGLLCDKRLPFCSECAANNLGCKYSSYSAPSPAPSIFDSSSDAWFSPNPCIPCRERLALCDRGLPHCTQCVTSNLECDYNSSRRPMQSGTERPSSFTAINASGSMVVHTSPLSHSHVDNLQHHPNHAPPNTAGRLYPLQQSNLEQPETNHMYGNISQPSSPSAFARHILRRDSPHMSLIDFSGPDSHCMDCQVLYPNHAGFCNISKCKPRKLSELTVAELGHIADAVERNDPEQWREHRVPPPTPELEGYENKAREMADIVRNEESYKSDPILHGLDDGALLILWALRTSTKIQTDIVWLDRDTPYYLESASDDGGDSHAKPQNLND